MVSNYGSDNGESSVELNLYSQSRSQHLDDRDSLIHGQDNHPKGRNSICCVLGKPVKKKGLHLIHFLAGLLSLSSLGLTIAIVGSETLSWRLGIGNSQLIVLGFLLSIMNLCLGSVAPTLFLLVEARFGQSLLQNYDGLIRNQIFASRLSLSWKFVLGAMTVLPLGLSIAYKTFTGDSSATMVNAADYLSAKNVSYYGTFPPPGVQASNDRTGISLFFNATLPFSTSTSSTNGSEPPIPATPQTYGFNILLKNNESAAILDIPHPDYITAIQNILALGETWRLTASVTGTVATRNGSYQTDPVGFSAYFNSTYEASQASSWVFTYMPMLNGWSMYVMSNPGGDQSHQFFGNPPYHADDSDQLSETIYPYSELYDITRNSCKGTWLITRGSISLVDGFCNTTSLPDDEQPFFSGNTSFLGAWFVPLLVEFLGQFKGWRNGSSWTSAYTAVGMATMIWSRIAVYNHADNQTESFAAGSVQTPNPAGLVYPVNDSVIYTRPTLKKSGVLYIVLIIQPAILVGFLVLIAILHSTPLDKGFGLVSILSGIERDDLDIFHGASLSGELREEVKIVFSTAETNDKNGKVGYQIVPKTVPASNGKLAKNILYY
jgi:hypothetical protein